ncbi:MAG: tetratricopeptide repeat protein [Bryobacterales bacterium]|nr:tetratricopeptide repeat protein [Bryobacterales bacterium]
MLLVPVILWAFLAQGGECRLVLSRAQAAYQERRYADAIGGFRQAIVACPDDQPLLLPLAQAQLMAQRLEDSRETLETMLLGQPLNLDGLKLLGDVEYLLGREAEAQAALLRALRIDPLHKPSLYALGRVYYQQNRIDDSLALFLKLTAEDARDFRAHDNLALCYAALQRDTDAVRHFMKALDLVYKAHPEYDVVYANFANFLLDRSQFEQAFQLAATAAERNPNSARNFFLTGKALVKLEKLELSVRWLKEAGALDPSYTEPHYWLAQVYRKLGRRDEAKRELEIFRELSKAPKMKR